MTGWLIDKKKKNNMQVNQISSSHRHKLLDGEVILQRGIAPVTPGPGIDGHAVFPFVFEQMSGLVTISTGVISTVGADATVTPSVICHHCLSYWAAGAQTLFIHSSS